MGKAPKLRQFRFRYRKEVPIEDVAAQRGEDAAGPPASCFNSLNQSVLDVIEQRKDRLKRATFAAWRFFSTPKTAVSRIDRAF